MALDIRSAPPDSAAHLTVGSVSHHNALTGLCSWLIKLLPSCEADMLIVMQTQTCSAGQQDAALMPPEHKA